MENSIENYQMHIQDLQNLPKQSVFEFKVKIFDRDLKKTGEIGELCGRLVLFFANVKQIQKDGRNCDKVLEKSIGDFRDIRAIYNSKWDGQIGNLTRNAYEALNFTGEEKVLGNENFVYIQTLEILEKHRNKGVGIYILTKALKYLANNLNLSFFVMIPHPLQDVRIGDGKVYLLPNNVIKYGLNR